MYRKFSKLLQNRGVTAYRVAKETGVSQASLSDWKSGKVKHPTAENLLKIAKYFGVDIAYFLE